MQACADGASAAEVHFKWRYRNVRNIRGLALTVLGLLLVALLGCTASSPTGRPEQTGLPVAPTEGAQAPDLTLTDLDGQQVTLSDLRGNRVLLNFWATWCAYCRGERGVLQQAHDEQGSQGLVILAVAIGEDPDRLRSFVHERGLSYRILLDEDGSVSRTYRVRGIPSSFFIDRDGVIRVHYVGALEPELLSEYLEQLE